MGEKPLVTLSQYLTKGINRVGDVVYGCERQWVQGLAPWGACGILSGVVSSSIIRTDAKGTLDK